VPETLKLINKDLRLQAPTSSAYGAKWWVIDYYKNKKTERQLFEN
jgi:hypothetical protein